MKSWAIPSIPDLPGSGLPLRLHDTASGEVRATDPGPLARMYVCGITPYDATHMGHAFTYVTFDLINRAWRDAGHEVHYVQNVTDIDDPLLERAVATGQDWRAIADRETALFREDMAALNVIPPRDYIGAVEAIPSVANHVATLQERGSVYAVDSDLYFRVRSDPTFGSVSRLDAAEMTRIFGERGGDPDRPGKEDPLDCLVWQSARPDEPAWDTPLGHGRPGWHIECAAIAVDHLGMAIDVQGGGTDLIFPHHEMSAAEAQVLHQSHPFARHYVHSAMVGWQGHKMSKSRGNLVFVSTERHRGVEPAAIRLALLAHHYRSEWEWTAQGLAEAQARLDLWRAATGAEQGPPADATLAGMREALADDLQAPAALAAVDAWVLAQQAGAGEGSADPAAPRLVRAAVDALLGIRL
ncbi:MAG: cysteine--1-D-myo-inosityl 2-amino-2-deoxy-alpha-D-glucopyranoside ligase [Actinomycetota bacterium]|nr:cysteine--1-D-myo-inosityl 2-amino-2-deoxy-alpha-D-glucopyranoside ligase [Actinomycetota bacterium]